jgi:peroxiredoxin
VRSLKIIAITAGFIALIVSTSLFFAVKFFTDNANSYQQQQFTTITGATIKLSALLGKPVIITFWATDCPSCIAEIPHWRALYQRYHPQGLEIIAVAMYYNPPSHVVSMTQAQQLPYPVVLDLHGQHAHAFGDVQLTPSSFLIAPDGSISFSKIGKLDFTDLQSRIENDLSYSSTNSKAVSQ